MNRENVNTGAMILVTSAVHDVKFSIDPSDAGNTDKALHFPPTSFGILEKLLSLQFVVRQ